MLLLMMDYKDTDAVVERNTSIGGILAEVPNVLSEAEVRDLSKNLANLRLKNNVAVKDDFLRYKRMFSCDLDFTYNKKGMYSHSFEA